MLYVVPALLVHVRYTLLTFEYPEIFIFAGGSGGADVAEANVLVNPTLDVRTCTSVADPLFDIVAAVDAVLHRNAPLE